MSLQIGIATNIGCIRHQNEDAFWHSDCVFVVCDGMGGHQAGEVASNMAVNVFKNFSFSSKEPLQDIVNAIQKAHRVVQDAAKVPSCSGMGTTATLAVINSENLNYCLYLGHVGDSRAYLLRDSKLKQLTSDHSVVGEMLRNGTLTAAEAVNHPHRHVVTQAIGIGEIEIETHSLVLNTGDKILLCTDGLTDVVEEGTIQQVLAADLPQAAADKLIVTAIKKGGPDNITVIVIAIP